ncbi:hypothetical protein HETIRDRAFT_311241, partial [Heterobasidion irregulare TC 32-1]
VPLQRVLWADSSESGTVVHVLAKKSERRGLVLVKAEGNAKKGASDELAREWSKLLMDAAYAGKSSTCIGRVPFKSLACIGVKQQRRFKIFINPNSGPGNAKTLYKRKVEPILKACRCSLDITFTERRNHAADIAAKLPLDEFDALLTVSGDGMVHEVFNGLAAHKDPLKALDIPIVPMPAGSGNGTSINLLGIEEGLDISAAALNAVKGRPMKVDLCSILQNGKRSFSFMSQCVGLMADLDLGTEHLRWMGSNRFVYGYLRGILTRRICPVSVSIKAIETDKVKMVEALNSFVPQTTINENSSLPEVGCASEDTDGWITFEQPLIYLYAGKGPYVGRDLMQFPMSVPNDGTIDIVIQGLVSRGELLDAMDGADMGKTFWRESSHYFKAQAYRVKPLSKNGYLAIDGEKFPFDEYLIEVHRGLGTVMSMYGQYVANFNVPRPSK